MNIIIPCDSFTQKVIHHLYANAPIDIMKTPELFSVFVFTAHSPTKKQFIVQADLFKSNILFDIPDKYFELCEKKKVCIALHFKRIARRIFHEYMMARYECGQEATISLERFCEDRKIDLDIEISFEALIKSWKRYFSSKNREKSVVFRHKTVLQKRRKLSIKRRKSKMYSDAQLNRIIDRYVEKNSCLFHYRTNGKYPFRKKLREMLITYVYTQIGGRTNGVVTRMHGIGERSVQRHIVSFRQILEIFPPIDIETD